VQHSSQRCDAVLRIGWLVEFRMFNVNCFLGQSYRSLRTFTTIFWTEGIRGFTQFLQGSSEVAGIPSYIHDARRIRGFTQFLQAGSEVAGIPLYIHDARRIRGFTQFLQASSEVAGIPSYIHDVRRIRGFTQFLQAGSEVAGIPSYIHDARRIRGFTQFLQAGSEVAGLPSYIHDVRQLLLFILRELSCHLEGRLENCPYTNQKLIHVAFQLKYHQTSGNSVSSYV
jgi:hypothetical protein